MGWGSATKASKVPAILKPVPALFKKPQFELGNVNFKQLVTLDFETYFDTEYTLRKLSTSEYIRDERFKAHMVGIKVGTRKRRVIPHSKIMQELHEIDWTQHDLLCHNTAFDGLILSHHYGVVPRRYYDTLSMARGLHSNDIGAGLNDVAAFYNVGNKLPDVLNQSLGIRDLPKTLYNDMAEYCGIDVDLCLLIFCCMLEEYPAVELDLIDMTIRMFCDPVLEIDRDMVAQEHARELKAKKDLLLSIVGDDAEAFEAMKLFKNPAERALVGDERLELMAKRVVGSNEKFADLLRAEGIDPGVKISPSWLKKKPEDRDDSKKWAYAFAKDDAFMQELLESEDDRIRMLAECRISVKSTGNVTKAWRFLEATKNGWKLPVGLAYYRAHTGRYGGNNKMNMQNMKRGGVLRQAINAPKGHVIVVKDSGQIECRVNGWLWGQNDLIQAFRIADAFTAGQEKLPKDKRAVARGEDRDAYCRFADSIYGFEVTTENKMERFVGKVCVLGLGFQMGWRKLQATLAKGALGGPPVFFDDAMCKKIVNLYRLKNYRIVAGWDICMQIIEDMAAGREGAHGVIAWEAGKIWLPNGMCLKYPGLKKEVNEETGWDEWSYSTPLGRKKIYGGLLCENIVQALARIIVCIQMLEIGTRYRVVTMTHDEVVSLATVRGAAAADKFTTKAMMRPPAWCLDLPIACEGGFATNYSK